MQARVAGCRRSVNRGGCAAPAGAGILNWPAGEGNTNTVQPAPTAELSERSAGFSLNNRKYLGAKHRLLDFLSQTILSRVPSPGVFIDGFAGTGVVGYHFRHRARRVIANDLLYSNYVANQVFLNSTTRSVRPDRLAGHLEALNRLPPRPGYVHEQYGGRYFTSENAARIDAVREGIEELDLYGACTSQEKLVLLTSLLFAMDKAANTVGQYDAFLKHLHSETRSQPAGRVTPAGPLRHLVDSNVHKPLELRLPAIELGDGGHAVYNEDLNHLIHRLQGEVLYLDPPYNGRQYIDCYHVLENILRWDKPLLYGKTRKFRREALKSRYSRRPEAARALAEVIAAARCSHIFLSYNSEGIIPDEELLAILERKGTVEIFEREYAVFGNGAGSARRRNVRERLFYCRVREA
jgi:adenine-specific DNA-methyltransferase